MSYKTYTDPKIEENNHIEPEEKLISEKNDVTFSNSSGVVKYFNSTSMSSTAVTPSATAFAIFSVLPVLLL